MAPPVVMASMPTSATGTSPTDIGALGGGARDVRGGGVPGKSRVLSVAASRKACRARSHGVPRAGGFTLIEILVVVVIIGIITAGILLSVNITGRDRELERESDRLLALFNYAREQAEMQTREYGVMFQDDGYEFLAYDTRRATWRSVFEDDALTARRLPDGLGIRLSVEARPVVLTRPKDAKDKTPQVMIFSNGDLTTFAATLEREGGVRSVTLTEDSKGEVVEQPMEEHKP